MSDYKYMLNTSKGNILLVLLLVMGGLASLYMVGTLLSLKQQNSSPVPVSVDTQKPSILGVVGEIVRLISSQSCGTNCTEMQLGVICQGLAERVAVVKSRKPSGSTKGATFFLTGGYSTTYYSDFTSYSLDTVNHALSKGLQSLELKWLGDKGLGTGVSGAGYKKAMCGSAAVMRWLASNGKVIKPNLMCAVGNSGGAGQISYGLSVHQLENGLDMAVVTGGPPMANLEKGCFGTDPTFMDGTWPMGIEGRVISDYIMGWEPQNYCQNRDGSDPNVVLQAQATSIVSTSSGEIRDYAYPATKVFFVEGAADPIKYNGKIYYNSVTSPKNYEELSGVGHGVDGTAAGSSRIKTLLSTECKIQ